MILANGAKWVFSNLRRERIYQLAQVFGEIIDSIRPRCLLRLAMAPQTLAEQLEAVAQPRRDTIPSLRPCANALNQHERLAGAFDHVAHADVVGTDRTTCHRINRMVRPDDRPPRSRDA